MNPLCFHYKDQFNVIACGPVISDESSISMIWLYLVYIFQWTQDRWLHALVGRRKMDGYIEIKTVYKPSMKLVAGVLGMERMFSLGCTRVECNKDVGRKSAPLVLPVLLEHTGRGSPSISTYQELTLQTFQGLWFFVWWYYQSKHALPGANKIKEHCPPSTKAIASFGQIAAKLQVRIADIDIGLTKQYTERERDLECLVWIMLWHLCV